MGNYLFSNNSVAPTFPILLMGPTGAGKATLVNLLHKGEQTFVAPQAPQAPQAQSQQQVAQQPLGLNSKHICNFKFTVVELANGDGSSSSSVTIMPHYQTNPRQQFQQHQQVVENSASKKKIFIQPYHAFVPSGGRQDPMPWALYENKGSTAAIILVLDASNYHSKQGSKQVEYTEALKAVQKEIQTQQATQNQQQQANAVQTTPVLIYLNKSELEKSITVKEFQHEYIEPVAMAIPSIQVCAASFATGDGLFEGIDWLISKFQQ